MSCVGFSNNARMQAKRVEKAAKRLNEQQKLKDFHKLDPETDECWAADNAGEDLTDRCVEVLASDMDSIFRWKEAYKELMAALKDNFEALQQLLDCVKKESEEG